MYILSWFIRVCAGIKWTLVFVSSQCKGLSKQWTKGYFPILAFPRDNETKPFSTICGTELGKRLPGDECSEFMMGSLSTKNCFGGNNYWVEGLQITNNSPCWYEILCKKFCGLLSVSIWLSLRNEGQSITFLN